MIPDPTLTPEQINGRYNAFQEFSRQLDALREELKTTQAAQAAAEARANRAESLVRLYEAQLVTPRYAGLTLVQTLDQPENIKKLDAALAEKRGERWEILNITVLPGTAINTFTRVVTLSRVVVEPPAEPEKPAAAAAEPVTLAGLDEALSAMSHVTEWTQGAPLQMAFVPRIYAVFESTGCDMTGVKIMKSFKPGRKNDQWTMTAIFPRADLVDVPNAVFALKQAGFREVIAREGCKFIFDLPEAWTTRKTITAASMTIIDADAAPVADETAPIDATRPQMSPEPDGFDAELKAAMKETYEKAQAANPLPPFTRIPVYKPNQESRP